MKVAGPCVGFGKSFSSLVGTALSAITGIEVATILSDLKIFFETLIYNDRGGLSPQDVDAYTLRIPDVALVAKFTDTEFLILEMEAPEPE